jgi:hypothetical protein
MCRLRPGGQSQPKPAVKSQAKPGFLHGFPKPMALAWLFESRRPWLWATAWVVVYLFKFSIFFLAMESSTANTNKSLTVKTLFF